LETQALGLDMGVLVGIGAALAAVLCGGFLIYALFGVKQDTNLKSLLKASRTDPGSHAAARQRVQDDVTGKEYDRLKQVQKKKYKKSKQTLTKEERYFHAGIFTKRQRVHFDRLRWYIMIVGIPVMGMAGSNFGSFFLLVGIVTGVIAGIIGPSFVLDKKIKRRGDEIMYYLPLVIEQISIGVSSSLDIGPCLQRVVAMADERDTHNVVTELIRYAQFHIKSGISLEEALTEVGTMSGHTELKHAFMALASVAKHGGEISRQLQELADAVSEQRETNIEAKIKKLELEATGPVALVFLGFILIILIGFGLQIMKVFK
jgi:tight adherence protein C